MIPYEPDFDVALLLTSRWVLIGILMV